jgi:hypothetical protein
MMWSGARSTILESNAKLLNQFDVRGNTALLALIASEEEKLRNEAREHLGWETRLDSERDETFE